MGSSALQRARNAKGGAGKGKNTGGNWRKLAIEKGGDPVAIKIERRQAPTFAELWALRKADNMGELADGTLANYEGVLRNAVQRPILPVPFFFERSFGAQAIDKVAHAIESAL